MEQHGVGAQWSNVNYEIMAGQKFSFMWALYMMLIDSLCYLIIGWYFSRVLPSQCFIFLAGKKYFLSLSSFDWQQ